MTVQPFDECMCRGEICHVEQVWDDPEGHHWAIVRPCSTLMSGVYFVETDELTPVPAQGAAA